MVFIELIATLAVLQFLAFGALTGRARRLSGLQAPAVQGHPVFERMYRVQMNTLELLTAFLPSLYVAAQHWPAAPIVVLGALYLVGRLLYWRAYVTQPASRGLSFMLSMIPTVILAVGALAGVLGALVLR